MKKWKVWLLGAGSLAVAAVAIAVIAAVSAAGTSSPSPAAKSASPVPSPGKSTSAPQTPAGAWGTWQSLMQNKAFRDDYFALRRSQLDQQQAWWNQYAADPQGSAAQAAWQKLRTQEQADYTALLKKYGVTLPARPAPPAGLGQLQKLRNNAQFRADAQKLAGQFGTDMQAWLKQYSANPRSAAAVAAMNTLRTKYEADVKALLAKYGVTVNGQSPLRGLLGLGLFGQAKGGRMWFGGPALGRALSGLLGGAVHGRAVGPGMGGMMGAPAGGGFTF
jgi:hypothetical protein